MRQKRVELKTTVISTRMRLARNLQAYPFPIKQQTWQAEEVVILVRNALARLDSGWKEYDVRAVGKAQAMLLQEQHLISPALVAGAGRSRGTAFVSSDGEVSVMVNEEDHLREQYIVSGCRLFDAYERVSSLDDGLGGFLHFAYDKKLGFLTSCPSNVGTGLRASVMMFLPGLERCNGIRALVDKWSDCGLTVRGMFGEGTAAEGYRYQISNDKTLGLSETEILGYMEKATEEIAVAEQAERKKMLAEEGYRLKDECLRAYGVLTNCGFLRFKEMMDMLTQVKLGVALGFFKLTDDEPYALDLFIDDMRPYSFCVEHDLFGASEAECDAHRATVMRRVLPRLVLRTD